VGEIMGKSDSKRLYDIERATSSIRKAEDRLQYAIDERFNSSDSWQMLIVCAALISAVFAVGIFLIQVGWVG
jgi:hypothetical protein